MKGCQYKKAISRLMSIMGLLLVLSGCYIQGGLESVIPTKDYSIGDFVIEWHNDSNSRAYLAITHNGDRSKILWSSIPGKAFIAAMRSDISVEEQRGSFTVKEAVRLIIKHQSVDEILVGSGELTLFGLLKDWNGNNTATYSLTFKEVIAGHLQFDLTISDKNCEKPINGSMLIYSSSSGEHFFGFGEQFTHVDLKGHKVPILIQEQGIGRGLEPLTSLVNIFSPGSGGSEFSTYIAVPFYITSHMRSLFLENSGYATFDMRLSDRVMVKVFDTHLRGRILYGKTPLDLIERYTGYTGRMKALPGWLNKGAVVGMQGGTDDVYEKWGMLKQKDTPIAAFWLQDWIGKRKTSFGSQLWWNWELDRQIYHDWEQLLEDFNAEDIRVMGYINPFLVDVSEKPYYQRNLYKEACDNGYLIMNPDGEPYAITNTDFDAGMVDLTNPDASEWIKGIIKEELIGNGFSGWMADYCEALPFDAALFSEEDASKLHNRYPEVWARLNREAVQEAGLEGDAVFFMRSGFTKSPGLSALFWEGDQLVTWDEHDGLKSAIKGLLSGGISGFSLNHSDIGGFTTITVGPVKIHRSKELLMRWMEANAFTAVYRTHEGNQPENNAQFYSDEECLEHFSRFAKVYKALAFYREKLMEEAQEKGYPMVRHPFLHYPNDSNTYDLKYQFMLGRDFMIAPVVDEGATMVKGYLPEGQWVHLWTSKAYESPSSGERVEVGAPMGMPAVFYLSGSQDALTFVGNLKDEGILQ
ncbi:MAG: alpha-glucosidase [Thermodesulfobacteriota bacterium]|nr:alpha-glucosidase [Thermodesulfobacteriota bacterium]